MRMEHMTRGGNDFVFVSGNYKLQTKASDEWLYVVGDENGRRLTPPASDMGHGRVIHPIDKLLQKELAKVYLRLQFAPAHCSLRVLARVACQQPFPGIFDNLSATG
jgi:hypothetical protein